MRRVLGDSLIGSLFDWDGKPSNLMRRRKSISSVLYQEDTGLPTVYDEREMMYEADMQSKGLFPRNLYFDFLACVSSDDDTSGSRRSSSIPMKQILFF